MLNAIFVLLSGALGFRISCGQAWLVPRPVPGLHRRWGGPIEEIRPGDVVTVGANEKHWHGDQDDFESEAGVHGGAEQVARVLCLTRYIVRVEPLASASVDELAELLGPAIELIVMRQRD